MHGGLAEVEAFEVFTSPADSALRLMIKQKCMIERRPTKSQIRLSKYLRRTRHKTLRHHIGALSLYFQSLPKTHLTTILGLFISC